MKMLPHRLNINSNTLPLGTHLFCILPSKEEQIITITGVKLIHYLIFPHMNLMKQVLILFSF